MMTKTEYVKNNLTRWDRFKLNFFWVPSVLLAGAILKWMIYDHGEIPDHEGRMLIVAFILTSAVAITFHISGSRKVNRLVEEWEIKHNV